jgi:hypothetical protein
LTVTTTGLREGTYVVRITDVATNTYELGKITVMVVTNPIAWLGDGGWSPRPPVVITVGGGQFPLPAGLAPGAVADVLVADVDGLVDLEGTFGKPPPPRFWAQAVLIPTTNAPPRATGLAVLSGSAGLEPAGNILPAPTNAPSLRVLTAGLLVGGYTVSVTDTAAVDYVLGSFDVVTWTNPVIMTSRTLAGAAAIWPPPPITVGTGEFPLPAGLAPNAVVGVTVADAKELVDLEGTFGKPPPPRPPVICKVIVLAPTTDAPDGAMGRATLAIEPDNPTSPASVAVRTLGLLAGTYTVSVADETRLTNYVLGTFDVRAVSNWFCRTPAAGFFTMGGGRFALPAGLDATNVTTLAVADASDTIELTGDFANPVLPQPCAFRACAPLVPGPVATNVTGDAQLDVRAVKTNVRARFLVVAAGLPPRATLHLLINGVEAGPARSNRQGIARIKRLPKTIDPASVASVAVEDDDGNVLFSADF